jgi:type IV pilus assembly protein PilE
MINGNIFTTSTITKSQQKGFTLVELLIVVTIVGILAMIGIPSYQDSVRSGKRADAKGVLMGAANSMERYFTSNSNYTGAVEGSNGVADQAPETGAANYRIAVNVDTPSSYILTATPVAGRGMDGDGNLTLSSTGARTWGANNCWEKTC